MKKIQLTSSKIVSNYSEPYIIAEIGANHNGDITLAKRMIDSAIDCGCDAVKFQSWQPDSIVSKEEYAKNEFYNDGDEGKKHFGSLRQMVEKYHLTIEQHHELNSYCKEKMIDFCSTPFTNSETDLLTEIDVPFFKIASMDINNYNFLEYVASKKKPVIISTGMSNLGEIEAAISVFNKAGNDEIVLLHCISIYPPLFDDIHLNNISMLRNTFGYPVGFSDHTIGYSIPLASVALGACIIEKHFTLDKNMPGWDHEISANPEEMRIICRESKNIVKSLGSFTRTVSNAEQQKKIKFRRSAVVKTKLEAGHVLKSNDIDFKRPGSGIQPEQLEYLIDKKLKHNIEQDQLLKWSDFD
jgi:N-acetylneuraminate synthase